jgi:hypothetical protein
LHWLMWRPVTTPMSPAARRLSDRRR